jgi:hypothetical protein
MEQGQKVREPEQVKAQGEVAVVKAGEEVLRQDQAVIASVLTVVKEHPISWVAPVMSKNVPNAAPP